MDIDKLWIKIEDVSYVEKYAYAKDSVNGEYVVMVDHYNKKYHNVNRDSENPYSLGVEMFPTHLIPLHKEQGSYNIPTYGVVHDDIMTTLNCICDKYNLTYKYFRRGALNEGEYTYPNKFYHRTIQVRLGDLQTCIKTYLQANNLTIGDMIERNSMTEESGITDDDRYNCMYYYILRDLYFSIYYNKSYVDYVCQSDWRQPALPW